MSWRSDTLKIGIALAMTWRVAAAAIGSGDDAAKAATAFEQARTLGNETPHLLGLQGDAYYRMYRATGRGELLALAIERKQQARDAGGISRENLSLSARLSFTQWQLVSRFEDLIDAVIFVAAAHEIAPNWPWPPFQLAELLDDLDPEVADAAVAGAGAERPAALLDVALRGGAPALAECGARLVVANEEFRRTHLGGTGQRVYVLGDPHGLLSASYVFIPASRRQGRAAVRNRHGAVQDMRWPTWHPPACGPASVAASDEHSWSPATVGHHFSVEPH